MSFCDEILPIGCEQCYEFTADDCLPKLITTNLTPATQYYLICFDKYDNRYDVGIVTDGNGDFEIDPASFPSGLFNPYAGKFEFVVSLSTVNVVPVAMTIGSTVYYCIIGEWSVTCCNNTYVPPTACETFLEGLSDSEIDCICDNMGELCPGGCLAATVKNSDNTFNQSVASGATYILADEVFAVYLDGVLQSSVTVAAMQNNTINIIWN